MNDTDLPEHFVECDDQEPSKPCICEEIHMRKIEDSAEAQMEFERGN
jgi:hypothetical protein